MESERGKKPLHTAHYAESQLNRLVELLFKNAPLHQSFQAALVVVALVKKLTYQQIEIEFRHDIYKRSKALLQVRGLTPQHRETLENIMEITYSCEYTKLLGVHCLVDHIVNRFGS